MRHDPSHAPALQPEPADEPDSDPLAERLSAMRWPEPDERTRERLLREFQQRLDAQDASPARSTD